MIINRKFTMWLEIIMLIVWLITLGIFLSQVWGQGPKCMANPLNYGAKVLSEQNNNTGFNCKCRFENQPGFTMIVNTSSSTIYPNEKLVELDLPF